MRQVSPSTHSSPPPLEDWTGSPDFQMGNRVLIIAHSTPFGRELRKLCWKLDMTPMLSRLGTTWKGDHRVRELQCQAPKVIAKRRTGGPTTTTRQVKLCACFASPLGLCGTVRWQRIWEVGGPNLIKNLVVWPDRNLPQDKQGRMHCRLRNPGWVGCIGGRYRLLTHWVFSRRLGP